MINVATEFYNGLDCKVPAIVGYQGEFEQGDIYLPRDSVYTDNQVPPDVMSKIGDNIENLYSSVRCLKATVDGHEYAFEAGRLEGELDCTELRVATYSSSLTGNLGNGFEIARLSAYNPHRSYIYIAPPGNGLSSGLASDERRYLRKTGRLLDDNNHPLPVVRALAKVLSDQDIEISRLGSDSAGALLTTAYGAAFGRGRITSSHQNVRTNVRDQNLWQMVHNSLIKDAKISKPHAEASPDSFKMTPKLIEFTKQHVGDEYRSHNYKPKTSIRMLASSAVGLGRGPEHGNGIQRDNLALLRTNGDAKILFTLGSQDPFSAGPDLEKRIQKLVCNLSRLSHEAVTAAIVEGVGHNLQTHYPQLLQAISRSILG